MNTTELLDGLSTRSAGAAFTTRGRTITEADLVSSPP